MIVRMRDKQGRRVLVCSECKEPDRKIVFEDSEGEEVYWRKRDAFEREHAHRANEVTP